MLLAALLTSACAHYAPLAKVGSVSSDGRLVVAHATNIGGKKQIVHYVDRQTGRDFWVLFDGVLPFGFEVGCVR